VNANVTVACSLSTNVNVVPSASLACLVRVSLRVLVFARVSLTRAIALPSRQRLCDWESCVMLGGGCAATCSNGKVGGCGSTA
jgi:hypothetical protein